MYIHYTFLVNAHEACDEACEGYKKVQLQTRDGHQVTSKTFTPPPPLLALHGHNRALAFFLHFYFYLVYIQKKSYFHIFILHLLFFSGPLALEDFR